MTNIQVLKNLLLEHVVTVSFIKSNGENRLMKCTLRPDMIPVVKNTGAASVNEVVTIVYDLEKQAWRSFRNDSVTGFN